MGYGNTNSPGAVATIARNGLMSAADKLDLETLKGLIPFTLMERTASGNPVTISDACAANLQKLAVTLTPTQSGAGDPYPPGGGPNIVDLRHGRPNETSNGVTYTRNDDGSYMITGTQTAHVNDIWFRGQYNTSYVLFTLLAGHTYLIRDCVLYYTSSWQCLEPGTHTLSNDITICAIRCVGFDASHNGETYNTIIYPMALDLTAFPNADSSGETWYPYANEITGKSSVTVTRMGTGGANSASVTVPLVDGNNAALTVYGGTLDVTAGTLTVTWGHIASYNGETLPGRWVSSMDAYAPGTSPTNGAEVAYELAPADYQSYSLTAQSLAALAGNNFIFTSSGSVSVTYRADPSLAYAELKDNLTNAILSLGAGI